MSQPDTRQRILDAAERLFAERGFHNTSLRTITSEAGANLAAVNYHFGSKEALLEALFERRMAPLNRLRRSLLQGVQEAAGSGDRRPEPKEVLRAYLEPTLHFRTSGPGAGDFIALVGRSLAEPDGTVRNLLARHTEPIHSLLLEALARALPDLPREVLVLRLHFVLGAMSHTMCTAGRFDVLPGKTPPPEDIDGLSAQLLAFATAGMTAP